MARKDRSRRKDKEEKTPKSNKNRSYSSDATDDDGNIRPICDRGSFNIQMPSK